MIRQRLRTAFPIAAVSLLASLPAAAQDSMGDILLPVQKRMTALFREADPIVVGIRVPLGTLTQSELLSSPLPRISVTGPFQADEGDGPSLLEQLSAARIPSASIEHRRIVRGPVDRHGTGLIYDSAGHIVTTYPTVRDCTEGSVIYVTASSGTEYPARMVGLDPHSNIAVLQADGIDGTPARLHIDGADNPRMPEPGTFVFCVARPYGLPNSALFGMVSGTDRTVRQVRYERLIQTTLPLHPGSNGAPVLTSDGSVIGMLSCTLKQPGWDEISFAIPSYMLADVADRLIRHGHVARGFLGVRVADPEETAFDPRFRDLHVRTGAVVVAVYENTPAQEAGLRTGDVITRIDNTVIGDREDVVWKLSRVEPDENITIFLQRDGREQVLSVKVSSLPESVSEIGRRGPVER